MRMQVSASEGSAVMFAHSLADLVRMTRQGVPQDLAGMQQLLVQATSDLLAGQYAALAFIRKVSSLLVLL